jgi:hypothetical protein
MHAAEGPAWALAIEHSAFGEAMRGGVLLYPLVEMGHILGLATLVGSILVLDLRLIGLVRGLQPAQVIRVTVPVAACGLVLAAMTGSCLFIAEAAAHARSPLFYLKQSLILFGLVNIVVFHRMLMPRAVIWPVDSPPPTAARIAGAISAITWVSVLACGRLLAYV